MDGPSACLGNQARILDDLREWDEAIELYKRVEQICREIGIKDRLMKTIGNRALILADRDNLNGALELQKEVERFYRKMDNVGDLVVTIANQSSLLKKMGKPTQAAVRVKEAYRLAVKHQLT